MRNKGELGQVTNRPQRAAHAAKKMISSEAGSMSACSHLVIVTSSARLASPARKVVMQLALTTRTYRLRRGGVRGDGSGRVARGLQSASFTPRPSSVTSRFGDFRGERGRRV